MTKFQWSRLIWLIAGIAFVFSGCASLDKAKSLNREGKHSEALKMAQGFLGDDDPKVRSQAAKVIGDICDKASDSVCEDAGDSLMPLLDDPVESAKIAGVESVGKCKYAGASKKLVSMTLDAKGDLFEAIGGAIKSIGKPATERLIKVFSKSKGSNQKKYLRMIKEVGPEVVEGIITNMKGKSYFENKANFDLLIFMKNPRTASLMLGYIEDPEVAPSVVDGLIKLGANGVDPTLRMLEGLVGKPGKSELKERLIKILGEVKVQKAIPVLEKLANGDDDDRVRNQAARALSMIRGF